MQVLGDGRHDGQRLRVPSEQDVARMAQVSVLGFEDSEIFRFIRPLHQKFPKDSQASFANWVRARMRDPYAIVVLAEDWPESEELSSQLNPQETGLVIVGVASWRFPPKGRPQEALIPYIGPDDTGEDRDMCPRRAALFGRATEQAEREFFEQKAIVDKLVVHPSYRRRGWAEAMILWGTDVCNSMELDQGVIASQMGQAFYTRLGFEVVGEMRVPDDPEAPGFTQRVMARRNKGDLDTAR